MQVQMPSKEEARVPSKSRIMVLIGTGCRELVISLRRSAKRFSARACGSVNGKAEPLMGSVRLLACR